MTQQTSKLHQWRYLIVIIICVLLNEIMYTFAEVFGWPVWLDTTGTALAALMLEPAAGMIVGLINNFYLALQMQSPGTIIYYGVSAAVAVTVGVNMRRPAKSLKHRVITTILIVIALSTLISGGVALLMSGGIPTGTWERHFYELTLAGTGNQILAGFMGVLLVKIPDTLAVALSVAVFYKILPKSLKNPLMPQLEQN